MCYGDDARPPLPPVGGAAADQGDLTLSSADGTKFMAYYARASRPTGAGMVVLPDVRGLHQFFKELAQRFAEAGIDAVAIDYFARTADSEDRSDGFDYMPHVQNTTMEGIAADVGAGIDYLRSDEGGAAKSVFTVGFCFGGSNSWNAAAAGHGLAGAVGFYGRPGRVERFADIAAPILALMGGADEAIPREEVEAFDRALSDAGVEHEVEIYDGAPHSFFDRRFEEHAEASADAWQRVLEFIERHAA